VENNNDKAGEVFVILFILSLLSFMGGIMLDRWYMQTLSVRHGAAHWVTNESGISTFEWNKK
jgi:hypothetical protein